MSTNNQRIISYAITGIDKSGKRFKFELANGYKAYSINVWRGTLWGILSNGKRKCLRRYYN